MPQNDRPPTTGQPGSQGFVTPPMAAAGAATAGTLAIGRGAHAAGSDVIRIGLIGCGGRGTGAANDAMSVDPGVRLVAMADVFADRVRDRRERLKKEKPDQVQVDDAHCFAGLDGYKHAIESSDVVLIACAAKYHSVYLRKAIEAGKHVFVEKPHAIDPVGVREVTTACELARQKGLSVMSGLHSRHEPAFNEVMKRLHDGAIGEVVAIQETYVREPYNVVERDPKLSEVEFQFRAQMHFPWLSGDDVVQSLVHNVDRAGWLMQGQAPVKAHGLGGRSSSLGVIYGSTFDHHSVVYEYANGVRMYALCRTENGCYVEYSSTYLGTKGRCHLRPYSKSCPARIEGETNWRYQVAPGNPGPTAYHIEHHKLFSAIRSDTPINAGDYMAQSTLVAVMGQLASYCGRELTWDQVSKSDFAFLPKAEDVTLDMEPPVKPDVRGNYPVPLPGLTEFKI